MGAMEVGLITLALLTVFILAGLHIGVGMMLLSVVGIYLVTNRIDVAISILGTTSFQAVRSYTFGIIPLFILMGYFANLSGVSAELFKSANVLLRRVKGGLAMATVVANAIFAAITGVSVASAAVFTKIALPPMTELGYKRTFAVGTIAGSSILGMLLPPSILMIVYGSLTGVSIGSLFVAGIPTGLMLVVLYVIGIIIMVRVKTDYVAAHEEKMKAMDELAEKKWKIILKPWPMVLLIVLVLGGIWGGFFTAVEAGGVGAFGALLLVIYKGKFSLKNLWEALLETGLSTGGILILLTAAQMYSRMLAISGVVQLVGNTIVSLGLSPLGVLLLFIVVFLILGAILDSTSCLLLTIPLMFPIMMDLGFHGVWFGLIAIVAIEVGQLTPPFGISVFAIKAAYVPDPKAADGGKPLELEEIWWGCIPFIILMLVLLAIMIIFPQTVTGILIFM